MTDLDDARRRWIEERPRHTEYGSLLAQRLTTALKAKGIWFNVSYRAKTIDSLVKKLIKKPKHTYDSLPDKLGVRVLVRYRSELDQVVEAVAATFHCGPIDTKMPKTDVVGYLSIHADYVRLKEMDPEQRRFPVNQFWAELQIRTQAQHLWSEMSHDSIYKNDETIRVLPDDLKRRVNLMAGQIEVADREFDRLSDETRPTPEAELLHFLEPFYYQLTSERFDVELSLIVLRALTPLLKEGIPVEEARLRAFLDSNLPWLQQRYSMANDRSGTPVSPLFFQPETLLIYELLSDDEIGLRHTWEASLPLKELDSLAKTWASA